MCVYVCLYICIFYVSLGKLTQGLVIRTSDDILTLLCEITWPLPELLKEYMTGEKKEDIKCKLLKFDYLFVYIAYFTKNI